MCVSGVPWATKEELSQKPVSGVIPDYCLVEDPHLVSKTGRQR